MSKLKRRVTFNDLVKEKLLPWNSWRTTIRKIKLDGFPAYFDGRHYSFDVEEIEAWFKKRKVISKIAG